MPKTVELAVAQAMLGELIAGLGPDEEIVIVRNEKPVAKLVSSPAQRPRRQPGLLKDAIAVVAEDDDHLADFKEYMP